MRDLLSIRHREGKGSAMHGNETAHEVMEIDRKSGDEFGNRPLPKSARRRLRRRRVHR